MLNTDIVSECFDEKRQTFYDISDLIWDHPELAFKEYTAADAHAALLEAEGFRVTRKFCDMDTCISGEFGEGGPVIAVLGEYDALPMLSQEAGAVEPRAQIHQGNGHGCGHNLLGTGALMASTAIKEWLRKSGTPGRVRYYGCPAEEGGDGKAFMVRAGAFKDVDIVMCWHPNAFTGVNRPISLAVSHVRFSFAGRASHASAAPHLGRSALDAVELMNVGCNYMREHIPSSARLHYAITDSGGPAANVVQARATVDYVIRTRELEDLFDLIERVKKVAEGAALMTETSMTFKIKGGSANLIGVETLDRLMQKHLELIGAPPFDADDIATAKTYQDTVNDEAILTAYGRFGLTPVPGQTLSDAIVPFYGGNGDFVGSTDLGTVSWMVPTVYIRAATFAIGTPGHSWQLVAQGKLPAAHKGMEHAARALANCAIDLFSHPNQISVISDEFKGMMQGRVFRNPLPDEAEPR